SQVVEIVFLIQIQNVQKGTFRYCNVYITGLDDTLRDNQDLCLDFSIGINAAFDIYTPAQIAYHGYPFIILKDNAGLLQYIFKSLFRELFIGLISMSSSQNYKITLICPNNMRSRFPIIIERIM